MTCREAVMLAAPHTWPASIMSVLLAAVLAYEAQDSLSVSLTAALLAIAILTQAAVNALNDYFDYVKGSDTAADNVEASDSALVYGSFPAKEALYLACGFMAAAFALGIYCIVCAGWIPLAIAMGGAVVIALYSGGATPISYLPIGEAVSGLVMGAALPFASFYVLTRSLQPLVLVQCIPLVIGIALIMMTNNTCDIEKDERSGRKTLPVLLGRRRARAIYRALVALWMLSIAAIVTIWWTPGAIVVPFMVLAASPLLQKLCTLPLDSPSRIAAMGAICNANVVLGAFYAAAVLANSMALTL